MCVMGVCVCLTVKTFELSNYKSALYFIMSSGYASCCSASPHSEERVGGNKKFEAQTRSKRSRYKGNLYASIQCAHYPVKRAGGKHK